MNQVSSNPKVSVCIMTYNQKNYIRECIDSIVSQEVDFDFEVIVADDCSTDGTKEIVQDFAERFPNLIVPILHQKNVGALNNYLSVHKEAKGQYVAHLDGDDYALPGKLAAQTAVLDEEPDTKIVWHRMFILNEHGQKAIGMPLESPQEILGRSRLSLLDVCLFYGASGCHSGSMYRRSAKSIKNSDSLVDGLDYFFTISFLAAGGYARYIDAPYGVYRNFSTDLTVTKQPEGRSVGRGKLNIYKTFGNLGYPVRRRFAAQAFFEAFVRTYVGQPMVWDFLKAGLSMRALPMPSDFRTIWRWFNAHRHSKLVEAWEAEGADCQI